MRNSFWNVIAKSRLGNIYFFLILLVLISAKIIFVIPRFPIEGLDPSWAFGLVYSAEHLVFGKDIIYTFGPLSSIYTGFWSSQSHLTAVLLSLFIAASLCFYVYRLFENAGYIVKLFLVIFFFLNINSGADFFFSLLPAVAALYLLEAYSDRRTYIIALLHFGFISALLLLVKLSFGAESFICLLLLLVYYGVKKDVRACIVLAWSFFCIVCSALYDVRAETRRHHLLSG